jgi:metal-responsive CopG/Arc/MetJ family transcriptional regulator
MAQMGRPKSENPKNQSVKIRLDETMCQKLQAYSKENGISRTEVIRRALKKILETSQ